ncbi:MAG: helix-turn-helix domain-containing protein [Bacteroidota bacterium]
MVETKNGSFKSQNSTEKWLTTAEAADYLRVTSRTMQNYRDRGMIPFSQVGSKIYYKPSDLEEYLQQHYVPGFQTNVRRA